MPPVPWPMLPDQFSFASFAWSAASSGWVIGIAVQFTPLSGHLCEKDNFG